MKLETVPLRDDQTIQCSQCYRMSTPVYADLDGEPYRDYYCVQCATHAFITMKLEGSPKP
jgi:hypothetical protein